jgi:hypothetical protein
LEKLEEILVAPLDLSQDAKDGIQLAEWVFGDVAVQRLVQAILMVGSE